MKAVQLHAYGGVDQLHYEDAAMPVPLAGEVQVRVISTSVNPVDFKIRNGAMKARMPITFPAVLGRDVAGEVTALGPDVSTWKVGDHVMGLVNHSYAQFLTAKAKDVTGVPEGLSMEDAGVLPLVVQTGAQLIELGIVPKAGEVILVTGAAGPVGRTAVFVAKQQGATVIAGVRAKQKPGAESIGADQIVALDDEGEIKALPELDAIADTIGGETLAKLFPKLKKQGRIGTVVGKPEGAERAGIAVKEVYCQPDPGQLHSLAEAVRDGKLEIPIAKRMPLAEIQEAQRLAEKGADGKIALLP